MEEKIQCRQCMKLLDIKNYYKDNRTSTGFKGVCKHCMRENYITDRERKIRYQIQWNNEHPERLKEYQDRYRDKQGYKVRINYYNEKQLAII